MTLMNFLWQKFFIEFCFKKIIVKKLENIFHFLNAEELSKIRYWKK